ncbi:hypothetical protein C4E44_04520 [Pseudomonas sp. MWU12-2312b]|nr:hypothetical protein C4E44_04520 [Pseudomonas sp. MWU12-2312b]
MTTKQDVADAISKLRIKQTQEWQARGTLTRVTQAEIEAFNKRITEWVDGIDRDLTVKSFKVPFDGEGVVDLTEATGVEFDLMGGKASIRPVMEGGALVFKSDNLGEPFVVSRQQKTFLAQDQYQAKVFNEAYLYERIIMALPSE